MLEQYIQLTQIKVDQLSINTWIATATINDIFNNYLNSNKKPPKKVQSLAVRLLFMHVLKTLNIEDILIDHHYPLKTIKGLNVCFSHSGQQLAAAISDKSIGVDIECQPVKAKIAQRFFCPTEINLLKSEYNNHQPLRQWLWQIKECWIKIEQLGLMSGMKKDCSTLIPILKDISLKQKNYKSDKSHEKGYNYGMRDETVSYQLYINPNAKLVVIYDVEYRN